MSSTVLLRGLDFAPTASIDKVALNNKVVMMRAVVRRAKLHTINALVKKMQKLRNKKGTETQLAQNKSKADRLFEEVKIIKLLKPDYVSKYALGSTEKFDELVKKPSTTLDMRALARLAQQKFIQEVVDKFRAEHEDWKDLAAYLITKQTNREFKNKKTKEKMKKVATNMRASETLVQKFLGEKLKENTDDGDDNDYVDNGDDNDDVDNHVSGEDDSGEGTSSGQIVGNVGDDIQEKVNCDRAKRPEKIQDKMQTSKMLTSKKQTIAQESKEFRTDHLNESSGENEGSGDSGEEVNDTKLSIESDSESTGSICEEVDSDDGSDSEMENGFDDFSGDEDESEHNSEDSLAELDNIAGQQKSILSNKNSKSSTSKIIPPRKTSPSQKLSQQTRADNEESSNRKKKKNTLTEKVEGDMIIKKLDLQKNMDEDDIPTILLGSSDERPVKRRKIRMDAFFDTGEGKVNETVDFNVDEPNNDDFDREKGRHDDGNLDNSIKPTITAFNTCFVGSLRSADMMSCKDIQYRSNEEWKRIRHEAREQTGGRGRGSSSRGRGHGPPFRGRGPSRPFMGQRGRGRGRGFDSAEDGRHSSRGGGHDFGKSKLDSGKKEKGLHPSWEASKKRKQEQKMVFQAFTGKKMKFDD